MPKFQFDDHEIRQIGWKSDDSYETVRIGTNGVTHISHREIYCGEISMHWLEIWRGEKLAARFNVNNIDSIYYDDQYVGEYS